MVASELMDSLLKTDADATPPVLAEAPLTELEFSGGNRANARLTSAATKG